jgi:hypothetical protein
MVRAYLLVEGPHDVELIGRLLKWWGCKRVQRFERVDPFWRPLIPTTFPHGGDLLARVPVPTFFEAGDLQVAVGVAVGDSKIARTLHAELASTPSFRAEELDAIGIVLDADDEAPHDRWEALARAIELPPALRVALPIIACGEVVYPRLLDAAKAYLSEVAAGARAEVGLEDLAEFNKESGRKKALFAAMAAPLKPGKAMQVSIQDNRWLSESTRALPSVGGCLAFMEALLGRAPSREVNR